MSAYRGLALSLLSGVLLAAAWPQYGIPYLLFIAIVPLLLFEQSWHERFPKGGKFRFFIISWCGFLAWNALSTWWIWNSTPEGALMAFPVNSLFMALVFFLFHLVKRRTGPYFGSFVLLSFWLAFEYFHHRWDLTWPWLTLGNAFAGTPWMIQWYEYTGTLGGSLWVLVVNFLLASLCMKYLPVSFTGIRYRFHSTGTWSLLLPILLLPPLLSIFITPSEEAGEKGEHLVLIQPNFDPYHVKFDLDADAQMEIFLNMAQTRIHPGSRVLVLPETAVSDGIHEDRYPDSWCLEQLRRFAAKNPGLVIVTGASTWKMFRSHETPSATARKYGNSWYDAYNSALMIDSTGVIGDYHKSKLVPGVEKMPYPAVFGFLKEYAVDLGGTSGTLAEQEEREVFRIPGSELVAAPVICYESVFGEYVGEYVLNGANVVFVLTNDGWWGDTPGYRQHMAYASLRAIEHRVPVIRCTNTGVSCFIDIRGKVISKTSWWKQESLDGELMPGKGGTFYTRHGDYLGRAAAVLSPLLILLSLFLKTRQQH